MISTYKKFLNTLCFLSLFIVFVVMLSTTISRYAFNASLLWGEELSKYGMIYGVMFGLSACYLEDTHIKFTFISFIKNSKTLNIISFICDIFVAISAMILIYSGYVYSVARGAIISPGIGIEMYYFQSSIVVGGVLLLISSIINMVSRINKK